MISLARSVVFGAFVLSLLAAAGCETKPKVLPKFPVKGTVTLDGAPLADGEVYFKAAGESAVDIVPISAGQFSGEATVGACRVEIYAYKLKAPQSTGGYVPPGGATETKTNYLPAKYNIESTLKEEVKEVKEGGAPNEFKFEVTSQ